MRNAQRYTTLLVKLAQIRLSGAPRKDVEYRKVIFENFREWGGVYIKFLQILASSSRFLDGWGGPKEMRIFSQAPRESIDLSEYINRDDFVEISDEPVAAGSFAQVYHGRLLTGEDVAIKILRPSIKKNLKIDLSSMKRICWLLSKFLPKTLIDYNDAYGTYAKILLQETDYEREIENQNYFFELYRDYSHIVIPKVYEHMSSDNVIVQEFIYGMTLADAMSEAARGKSIAGIVWEKTGSNVWEQLTLAGGEALYTAMCADYVYGDPHPGNIILLSDNRIGFIDFGVIARCPTSHEAYYNWVKSYHGVLRSESQIKELLETTLTCFCPDLSLAMQKCSFEDGNLLDVLASAISQKFNAEIPGNTSYTEMFQNGHLMSVFIQLLDTQAFAVNIEEINLELLKAMQAFLGAVTILDNREGGHSFSTIMQRSMEYALVNAQRTGVQHDAIRKTRYGLSESYELLINTVSSLADSDASLFNFVKEKIFV